MHEGLLDHLLSFVSEHKRKLFEEVLAERTDWFTLVLEDIYQMQNASAVVRSCDCLGVQQVHVVENRNRFRYSEVSRGAEKWVDVRRHASAEAAIGRLREQGYRVAVVSPHEASMPVSELPIDQRLALVFGNELAGVSGAAQREADYATFIPMYGFTESFNVSVSAAIVLQTLMSRLRVSELPWRLDQERREALLYHWAKKAVRGSAQIEARFLAENPHTQST